MKTDLKRVYRILAAVMIVLLVLSMLPIAVFSWFDYPTGDDLGYSAMLHQLMLHGGSFPEALRQICLEVKASWYSWQGTWSSLFLFHLQPGIWGGRAYALTPWIAVGLIMAGTWALMKTILSEELKLDRNVLRILYSALIICSVQYMPKVRGGIFWYTSVAHYIIPYGIALFAAAWSMRFARRGGAGRYIGCLLALTYLGGAGYPEIVFSALWFLLLVFSELTGVTAMSLERREDGTFIRHWKRVLLLILPVILEMAGFLVSAAAPGNRIRGGDDFGFSAGRAVDTVWQSVTQGVSGILQSFRDCRLLVLLFPAVFLFCWMAYRPAGIFQKLKMPWLLLVCSVLLSCAVRAPEIYAGVDVSGGVYDSYFLIQNLLLTLGIAYAACSLKQWLMMRSPGRDYDKGNIFIIAAFLAAGLLYCAVMRREIILPSVDYTCYTFAENGQLADFEEQMQERLRILENEEITDAVVPEMNSEQGPFMHMSLLADPDAFTNHATALYYGKESVIAVPRDFFYEQYAEEMLGTPIE